MLAGPELFFTRGKSILPWHDEPDSPQVQRGVTDSSLKFDAQLGQLFFERSPYEPLPTDWQLGPQNAGITINVIPPASTAGKILHHCKDRPRGFNSLKSPD